MNVRHSIVIPLLAVAAIGAIACDRSSSPTEVTTTKAATANVATSATTTCASDAGATPAKGIATDAVLDKRGGGNSHGNGGNGHGHGGSGGDDGGGNGHGHGGTGTLQIQPDSWNLNLAHAQGTISALVRGIDVGDVDTSSVQLEVNGATIAPLRTQTAGGQLRAFFSTHDVIAALGTTAEPGDRVTVTLDFTAGGNAQTLTDSVRIVGHAGNGGGEEDHIEAAIHPDSWCDRAGTVTVMLHGDVANVDLSSLQLIGEDGTALDPTATPVRAHNGVTARFDEKAAFATLTHAVPGTHHPVKITFDDGSDAQSITRRVSVNRCGGNGAGGDDGD